MHARSSSPISFFTRMLAGIAITLLAAGCAGPLNNEVSVGQAWLPSTFDTRDDAIAAVDSQPPVEPSITSIDRTDWPSTRILAPNDRPAHQPLYTQPWFATHYRGLERRRTGKYPTQQSALQMPTAADVKGQAREGLVSPVAAAVDLILFPIRAIFAPPWQRTRTGFMPYDRTARIQTVPPAVAEPAEAPPPPPMAPAEPLYGDEPETTPIPAGTRPLDPNP